MCGICGIINPLVEASGLRETMRRMLFLQRHRGPDDAGYYADDRAILGQVRLSIQDLSEAGSQPMIDRDRRFVLVYNGEIYNVEELRGALAARGVRDFRGHSDTELLLNAYRVWGEGCLEHISGMYAFAVWDRVERRLFMARDRIGIKPLYYHWDGTTLAFASEIKSLLAVGSIRPSLNRGSFVEYMRMRYNARSESLFEGIRKLPPAHVLTLDGSQLSTKRYWRLKIPDRPESRSREEWAEAAAEMLELSAREHLISDVPVGVFLSGGIDSNTLMSVASKHYGEPLQTFSVGFSTEKGSDELDNIRVSAEHFRSRHHELILNPRIEDVLPKAVYAADEPLADPACIPTYLLSELAAGHVKVVLSGEGGDELFGGYERSLLMHYSYRYLRHLPSFVRAVGVGALRRVPVSALDRVFKYTSKLGRRGFDRLADFVQSVHDPVAMGIAANAVCDEAELAGLVRPEVLAEDDHAGRVIADNEAFYAGATRGTFLNYELRYEIETRLWADLLMKLDSSSMPFSLEGRVPYLDHRLVEFSAGIPPAYKIRGLTEKAILRDVSKKYLPASIWKRKKEHFFVPIDKWLAGDLRPLAESLMEDGFIREQGIFNLDYTRGVYERYQQGALVYARQIWTLVCFQIWYDTYITHGRDIAEARCDDSFRPREMVA